MVRESTTTISAAELSAVFMTVLTPARVSTSLYEINEQQLGFGTLGAGLGSQDSDNQEFIVELLCSI